MSESNNGAIQVKPIPKKLTLFAEIARKLFGKKLVCSYCGKLYQKCYSKDVGLFTPLGGEGKCCPDGHEGYTDHINIGVGCMVRRWYDSVNPKPENKG